MNSMLVSRFMEIGEKTLSNNSSALDGCLSTSPSNTRSPVSRTLPCGLLRDLSSLSLKKMISLLRSREKDLRKITDINGENGKINIDIASLPHKLVIGSFWRLILPKWNQNYVGLVKFQAMNVSWARIVTYDCGGLDQFEAHCKRAGVDHRELHPEPTRLAAGSDLPPRGWQTKTYKKLRNFLCNLRDLKTPLKSF